MKNILLTFIITFFLIGCSDISKRNSEKTTIEYYKNQTEFKKVTHYKDYDSVHYFYRDGNIFKRGKQLNEKQKIGNWVLSDKEGNIREIREWFPFDGYSRLNRIWHLNKNGDTLASRTDDGIYQQKEFVNDTVSRRATTYDIIFFNRDTLKMNEPLIGTVEIFSHLIRDHPANTRVLIAREENNYNYDFSNEKEVKLDTFYDLTKDTINQKWFEGAEFRDLATFGQWYDTVGEKTLRGFYQQYFMGPTELDEDGMKIDSIIGPKTFFEHKFIVIDSITKK
tara:strand:- start:1855 stop:2694 length:840 start_codon:yes stop_codon:yes gene_type:complete